MTFFGPLPARTSSRIWPLLAFGVALLAGCDEKSAPAASTTTPVASVTPVTDVPVSTYQIVNTWPHDHGAFTQGLVFQDGALLESTGLNGQSSLRQVELTTGRVLRRVDVPTEFFAEGMTVLNG